MATSHNLNQEYWKPAPQQRESGQPADSGACQQCGTELVLGSRFCHACGADRDAAVAVNKFAPSSQLNLAEFRDSLGLTIPSIVAFVIGLACAIAALVTGLLYTANTVLDWQAVQMWRIQWLLGALVAFGAALILKRSK